MILTLVGAIVFGATKISAQNFGRGNQTIVQKLVQKFNLKESDVQAVFDEVRQERQSQMQTKFEEYLTQMVKDGKITEDQKKAIIAKHKELQDKRNQEISNWQGKTVDERRQLMQEQRQELENWAKQNGIDVNLFFGKSGGFGKGIKGWSKFK